MTGYKPTRGRGSNSKSRGRPSRSSRDEAPNEDETRSGEQIEDETRSGEQIDIEDEVFGLNNSLDMNEEEETTTKETERRKKKRGPNRGTHLPKSLEERPSIIIKTSQGFNRPRSTREITIIVQGFTRGRFMHYSLVPRELHENMFQAFKEKFKWPTHTDNEVKKVFHNVASRRLRDNFCYLRKKTAEASNSNNPLDWRQFKPEWIDDGDWVKLLEEWASLEWQRISVINSKNKASTANGEQPKHTCGSVSSAVHEDRLAEEYNRPPTPLELFIHTHCNANGDFIDERSKTTLEKYHDIVEERWLDPVERPLFDPNAWIEATNGIQKCRVYGLGSSQSAMEVLRHSGRSRVRSYMSEIEELKKQLAESEEKRQKEMEDFRDSLQATVQAQIRELLRELNLPNSKFPSGSGTQ